MRGLRGVRCRCVWQQASAEEARRRVYFQVTRPQEGLWVVFGGLSTKPEFLLWWLLRSSLRGVPSESSTMPAARLPLHQSTGTIGNYGKFTGMVPGQCGNPQSWEWWTEHTNWEAGARSKGVSQWQRPKMTPTVRPPWGTMPQARDLRGTLLKTTKPPGTSDSAMGSVPGTGASRRTAGLATPRTFSELKAAREEIERLTELKSAREEIATLRGLLNVKGPMDLSYQLPPQSASSGRGGVTGQQQEAPILRHPANATPGETLGGHHPTPPPNSPRRLRPMASARKVPQEAVVVPPAIGNKMAARRKASSPRHPQGPTEQEGSAREAAARRNKGEAAMAKEREQKRQLDEERKKQLLNMPMTVKHSPKWNKYLKFHGRTVKPFSEGITRRPESAVPFFK